MSNFIYPNAQINEQGDNLICTLYGWLHCINVRHRFIIFTCQDLV